jgi:hypothetical protein
MVRTLLTVLLVCIGAAIILVRVSGPAPHGPCDKVASLSGNDANSGSLSSPYRSAQRLADSLAPGETGCLRGGLFDTNSRFADAGTGNLRIARSNRCASLAASQARVGNLSRVVPTVGGTGEAGPMSGRDEWSQESPRQDVGLRDRGDRAMGSPLLFFGGSGGLLRQDRRPLGKRRQLRQSQLSVPLSSAPCRFPRLRPDGMPERGPL